MSREYTLEEQQKKFVRYVDRLIKQWDAQKISSEEKLTGLANSIFEAMEGKSDAVPGYRIIPKTTQKEIEESIRRDDDYYPLKGHDIRKGLSRIFQEQRKIKNVAHQMSQEYHEKGFYVTYMYEKIDAFGGKKEDTSSEIIVTTTNSKHITVGLIQAIIREIEETNHYIKVRILNLIPLD